MALELDYIQHLYYNFKTQTGSVPQEGMINTTYLSIVSRLVQTLADFGIYTLVDMHQDVMGAQFCGEGLANWTVAKASSCCDRCCQYFDLCANKINTNKRMHSVLGR